MLITENVLSSANSFSLLHWNVNRLLSKIQDSEFVSCVCIFDLYCWDICWRLSVRCIRWLDMFFKPDVKFTRRELACILVTLMFGEKCFCTICTQLDIECGNCIMFTIDKMCWADKRTYCMCEILFHSRVPPVTLQLSWKMAQVCWWTVCLIAWLMLITFLWFCQVTWTVALQIFHSTLQQIRFFIHYAKQSNKYWQVFWIILDSLCWMRVLL